MGIKDEPLLPAVCLGSEIPYTHDNAHGATAWAHHPIEPPGVRRESLKPKGATMSLPRKQQRALLLRVARHALGERGYEADFPPAVLAAVQGLTPPVDPHGAGVRDLRNLAWCSIDNDDSRDLDQLTEAEALAVGSTRLLVAVADVSAAVTSGSALDRHAAINTTSVYTPPQNFPMLPDRLSTDLT